MNKKSIFIFLTVLLISLHGLAQSVVFPVSSNFQLVGALSPFVDNYYTSPIPVTQIRLTFTDAAAGNRDVFLRFSMESDQLKISTPPGYRPDPINLNFNTPYTLTASDLAPYFDQNRLQFEGNFASITKETGRLPEGLYKFQIDVYDYQSGALLSDPTRTAGINFAQANLRYNDPPRIISPRCEEVTPPMDPQRILFTWQSLGGIQAASQTEYRLSIFELTDPKADPRYAIYNNKIQTVFESDFNPGTTFLYDIQYPQLETGKIYIYQVQAIDRANAVVYKNDGKSEVCWFRYGYPTGGNIPLKTPDHESGFERKALKEFVWEAPDNRIDNQPFSYELRIVKVEPEQEIEDAISFNPTWSRKLLAETRHTGENKHIQQSPRIEDSQLYAWQVTCNSGSQEVAKSEVRTFYGPQTLESFMAGTQKVEVISTKNRDVTNLSGKAKINLGPYGKIKGDFSNIHVEDKYGTDNWILKEGAVVLPLDGEIKDIELKPMNPRNEKAWFRPDSIKVDQDGIWLGGYFDWEFPHPVDGEDQPRIKSKYDFVPFNQYRLNGAINLPEGGYKFGLAEPMDYEMRFDDESHIFFTENYYTLKMYGDVKLPKRMTEDFAKEDMVIPFYGMEQLFYLRLENNRMPYNFQLVSNGKIFMKPTHLELDLDPTQSPQPFQYDGNWKGVYFRGFELEFLPIVDQNRQLTFDETFTKKINRETDPAYQNVKSWFDSKGFQFEIDGVFNEQDSAYLNSFPCQMTQFYTKVENSLYKEGKIRGKFRIPVVSATQDFNYTIPMSYDGLTDAFMEADLAGQTFVYNEGTGDQEVHLTINRVVFKDYNHLDFNIDLKWPGMDCHLKALRNFKAWGNHSCGFLTPNGTFAADEQARAYMGNNKYPVVLDAVGIGSDYKTYSFAVTGKIQLGIDVVGKDGPPVVNLYSVVANPYGIRIYNTPKFDPNAAKEAFDAKLADFEKGKEEIEQNQQNALSKIIAETDNYLKQNEKPILFFDDIIKEGKQANPLDTNGFVDTEEESTNPSNAPPQNFEEAIAQSMRYASQRILNDLSQKIVNVGEDVTTKIDQSVEGPTSEAESFLDIQIDHIFDGIEQNLLPQAKIGGIDLTPTLMAMVNTSRTATSNELKSSLRTSVDRQIVEPLATTIEVEVQDQLITSLEEVTQQSVLTLIKSQNTSSVFNDGASLLANSLDNIVETVYAELVSPQRLQEMTFGLASSFVREVSVEGITNDILKALKDEALKAGKDLVVAAGVQELNNALQEQLGGAPINFFGASDALTNGRPQEVFKTDYIPIKVISPIVDVIGNLEHDPYDPDYGDVWKTTNLDIKVKVPKEYLIRSRIMQGRKDGTEYWLMEAGAIANDSDTEYGSTKTSSPNHLTNTINLGLVELTQVAARISKHMSDNGSGKMLPDLDNNYNAMFHMIMQDVKSGDVLNLDVQGDVNSDQNGTTLALFGDVAIRGDMVNAQTYIYFNSAEDHFICDTKIKVEKDGAFCAEGQFIIDVKPSEWRIAMGTRDMPINVVPGCAGWGGIGYVDMDQSSAEVGAGLLWQARARSPKFPLIIYKVSVGVDAGLSAMMFANINYRPVRINEAGLIVHAWAYIWEEHKRFVGCGIKKCRTKRNNIVEIEMRGDLVMRFHPKPTQLSGSFKGKVRILKVVGIGFKSKFSVKLA